MGWSSKQSTPDDPHVTLMNSQGFNPGLRVQKCNETVWVRLAHRTTERNKEKQKERNVTVKGREKERKMTVKERKKKESNMTGNDRTKETKKE